MEWWAGALSLWQKLSKLLLSVGSTFLADVALVRALRRRALLAFRLARRRRLRAGTLLRALFPKRILTSPSVTTDIWYFIMAVFVFGVIFGWALISYQVVSNGVTAFLAGHLGARAADVAARHRRAIDHDARAVFWPMNSATGSIII